MAIQLMKIRLFMAGCFKPAFLVLLVLSVSACGQLIVSAKKEFAEDLSATILEFDDPETVKKGVGISYGHTFHTTKDETLVATIPIGYADGYARRLSNKAQVIVGDTLCPQIGNICMDHMMVDVTEAKGVQVLDEVILMGEKGDLKFTADDMARLLDTINYEVICDISPRVPRVYLDSKEK